MLTKTFSAMADARVLRTSGRDVRVTDNEALSGFFEKTPLQAFLRWHCSVTRAIITLIFGAFLGAPLAVAAQSFERAVQIGGASFDYGEDIASDADGNSYVTGTFRDTATFAPGVSLTSEGYSDIFVASYDPSGTLRWDVQAGGASADMGRRIAFFDAFDIGDSGTLLYDGLVRTYWAMESSQMKEGAPILLGLHGSGGTGNIFCVLHGMDIVAENAGAVLVCPDATNYDPVRWANGLPNAPTHDDVGFLVALVDHVRAQSPVPLGPVLVFGFSSGGSMAWRLACESTLGERYAVSAALLARSILCDPQPAPIMLVFGTADVNVPIEGNSVKYSLIDTLRMAGAENGCNLRSAARSRVPPNTTLFEWVCDEQSMVYAVRDGVHGWSPDGIFNTTGAVWSFFNGSE
ncbi:MAG: alpha/beta fold hydrolase [Pseudomonadota bacterium]|nr:alpha/beta fold hydrolase [Pseudomonadota bacterium]